MVQLQLSWRACLCTFRYFYNMGTKQFNNLLKHIRQNDIAPESAATGPKAKTCNNLPVVQNLMTFLLNHFLKHGFPHPTPLHGRSRDGIPPVLLPASQTYMSVHKLCISPRSGVCAVGYSSFRSVWHRCLPHLPFITVRTDVCNQCECLHRQ